MYTIYDDDAVTAAVATMPRELLDHYAELRAALEVSPRTVGRPLRALNPDGLRSADTAGGRILLVFGVIERDRRVDLLQLTIF
ncbi:hypothetical protein [Actinomycetospora chiangmaiensis]|uniref:hypothetical protein n=1 Tax=Actinomycetospora chiangmaiensis TaxID=402650 RepID=UPI00036AFA5A|nr:hypothetical protein [Actinomycetospora chiangmaiensis]